MIVASVDYHRPADAGSFPRVLYVFHMKRSITTELGRYTYTFNGDQARIRLTPRNGHGVYPQCTSCSAAAAHAHLDALKAAA